MNRHAGRARPGRAALVASPIAPPVPRWVRGGSETGAVLVYLWVGIGGALGSVARFWLTGVIVLLTGPRFPWGTLLINVMGSFVIGLVAGLTLIPERVAWHPDVRIFLMTGVCGGFTTFSAFSLQTLELLQAGETGSAAFYAVASVLLCLMFTWAGFLLARV